MSGLIEKFKKMPVEVRLSYAAILIIDVCGTIACPTPGLILNGIAVFITASVIIMNYHSRY
jgi:hypothetical protein